MRAFADALDSVPMALAENSGLSPIETLANIKSRQAKEKNYRLGVDCMQTGSNGKCTPSLVVVINNASLSFQRHLVALVLTAVRSTCMTPAVWGNVFRGASTQLTPPWGGMKLPHASSAALAWYNPGWGR